MKHFKLEKLKWLRITIFSLLTFASSFTLQAQNDTVDIKNTIHQLFEGMATFDTFKIKKIMGDAFSLQSIINSSTSIAQVRKQSSQNFLNSIGTVREGVLYDERLSGFTILIDGDMAMAWTPYQFFLTGEFSHCGVNLFTLMRVGMEWKILSITDTRRKTDCK